jgi:hypothetical protein
MTFDVIVTEIKERLNQTSTEATTRIGREVNDRYKRVTSSLGIQTARRTTVNSATSIGTATLAFSGVEKIYNVVDRTATQHRMLGEVTVDELREIATVSAPVASANFYAVLTTTATTVTILLDITPTDVVTLYADGIASAATLSGSTEPSIPQSFHDIFIYGVMADEYRKMMRMDLAKDAEGMYAMRLGELRLHLASSAYKDLYQGKRAVSQGINQGRTFL